jgi:hypothetical protein
MALASRLPPPGGPPRAELRLSWRFRSEVSRACRRRTAEELARLPRHMREEEVCERGAAPYQLRVAVGGALLDDRMVRAVGTRGDRPLSVFASHPVTPGQHPVTIEFLWQGTDTTAREHISQADVPTHALPPPAPRRLVLDTTVVFDDGAVVVVSYDERAQRLRVVRAP